MEGPSVSRFVKSRLLPIIEPLSEERQVEGEWAERFNAELTANSRRLLESLRPLTIPVATRR
jgi:serine/threonine-protein kinase HipA